MTVVRAPGRVNLIGDHTDYQDGLCLPMAIDREVRIEVTPRVDGEIRVVSEHDPSAYVAAIRDRVTTGIDATVTSTVPVGSGLSSSAAFSVALLLAADPTLHGRDLALAAQELEHRASGVPCGVMDQMASVFGVAGHALLLDCRDLTVEPIPIPAGVDLVVIHSGLPRRLESSAYAKRRAACEAAAAALGVATLRDATEAQVSANPLARHVVSENERVRASADALRAGDNARFGDLMLAGHASLRDDFGVSTLELDLLVTLCTDAGAYGARLTGAGFGGCVVALVPAGTDIAGPVAAGYRARTGLDPQVFTVTAADGAGVM